MAAMVSHYPRVSEWVYIGDTAINMAQVTGIEFGNAGSGTYAIVRLSRRQRLDHERLRADLANRTTRSTRQAAWARRGSRCATPRSSGSCKTTSARWPLP